MKIILYVLSNSNYMFDKLVFNDYCHLFIWCLRHGYVCELLYNRCEFCYLYENFINGRRNKIGVIYVEEEK